VTPPAASATTLTTTKAIHSATAVRTIAAAAGERRASTRSALATRAARPPAFPAWSASSASNVGRACSDGWNRPSMKCGLVSSALTSSSVSNASAAPCSRRLYSQAAAITAAIAPADAPPTLRKTYFSLRRLIAAGYTTPLVIPPFMTRSHGSSWGTAYTAIPYASVNAFSA
jgi:hypothetical protein